MYSLSDLKQYLVVQSPPKSVFFNKFLFALEMAIWSVCVRQSQKNLGVKTMFILLLLFKMINDSLQYPNSFFSSFNLKMTLPSHYIF
jgi:hypothetical protein